MALEAAVTIRRQIDPDVAALAAAGLVYRARAAEPTAVVATGDEAQERQDLLDRNLRSQHGKVDGWHDQRIRQSRPGREEDRVEEAGRLAGLRPLDPIEPELVDGQEVEVAVVR
jgi:hypothetical protein